MTALQRISFIEHFKPTLVNYLSEFGSHEIQYDITVSKLNFNHIINDNDLGEILIAQDGIVEPDHSDFHDENLETEYYNQLSISFLDWMLQRFQLENAQNSYQNSFLFSSFLRTFELDDVYNHLQQIWATHIAAVPGG